MTDDTQTIALVAQVLRNASVTGDMNRANFIFDLAAFSFLIEQGIVTPEQVNQRLALIQSTLPPAYRSDLVSQQLNSLADTLRQAYAGKSRQWTPVVISGGLDQKQDRDPSAPNDPNP